MTTFSPQQHTATCSLPVETQRAIAEDLLGAPLVNDCAPCPGRACHTTGHGARDFRLFFEPGRLPREYCFHQSCLDARSAYMAELIRLIRAAERDTNGQSYQRRLPGNRPLSAPASRPDIKLDMDLAERTAARCTADITLERLRDVSPVTIPAVRSLWPAMLLDALYDVGERLLVFYNAKSQGHYLRVAGKGWYQLADRPGVRATPVDTIPLAGREGAWFLCAPVVGGWKENPWAKAPDGSTKMGRRHAACCTRYPFAVLESDAIPLPIWLKILVQLREPIAAIYTSGGRSVHALIKVDCKDKAEFDHRRLALLRYARIGADPAAITAVRLTRLPGILRGKKLQELVYINPTPSATPIIKRPVLF